MVTDRQIAALSDYVRKMTDGEIIYDVRDNREGAFSILKNDVYKLALRLSEQAALLRREKETLKDILYDISHQLKTPITSMTIMADLLEQEDLPTEKRREFVGNLQSGLTRMDWLVKSLLKLARLDAEAGELVACEVNAAELVEDAAANVRTIIEAKNQEVTTDVDGGLTIHCDRNWTTEALVNIIKNGAEHTPAGGRLAVSAGENPVCAWICVEDCGGGIDPDELNNLFKRFYRGRNSAKDSAGIGLAMSLAIMHKQNGDIEVKTERGKGASFTLKFFK